MKRFTSCLSFILLSINLLSQSVDTTSAEKVYELGKVEIVSQKVSTAIGRAELLLKNHTNVSDAMASLPSVSMVNYGSRNESGIMLRGFDSRAVPLYIDGIPVYIPYDGLIDLGRFKTYGYSKIDISKGLSPMAYGPNTLGGAINLVTIAPTKKLEFDAVAGAFSGKGIEYGFRIGSRVKKWYYQADFFSIEQENFPLSKEFKTIKNEDGISRNNSYYADQNMHLKVGFVPNAKNEFTINLSHQVGEKGNPPYAGTDPLNKARYWQWPVWNKTGVYFISNSSLTDDIVLKTRIFYNKFDNKLESYDDSTYTTQTKGYAFTSYFDDYDLGGNFMLEFYIGSKHKFNLSAHFKNDHHSEHNEGQKIRKTADNSFSLGFDHIFTVNSKTMFISGLSYNIRQGILAEDYFSANDSLGSFPLYSADAINGQFGVIQQVGKKMIMKAFIAHKTRFATMKERYSYKMGRGLPNPELDAEKATHYEMNFNYKPLKNVSVTLSAFYINIVDVIQTVDEVLPGVSQMQNTGRAEFQGFDFDYWMKFSKNLALTAGYSYISRKNITNPELFFTDVPEHKMDMNFNYQIFKNLATNIGAVYYSDRYSTSYGIVAKEFYLLNLSANYRFKTLIFSAGVNNLLDYNYQFSEGFPNEGRNYFAKVIFNYSRNK